MRSMPSVEMFSTCVSPRWKSPEPCVRDTRPTSADSGRMSFEPRPSRRTPSSTTRRRISVFSIFFNARLAAGRSSSGSSSSANTSSATRSSAAPRSCLLVILMTSASFGAATCSTLANSSSE